MANKKPNISVFFPCYNDGKVIVTLVEKAINNLKNVASDWEVIVIDDGSSDNSREALKQALTRASILSNEKFRGIRLHLDRDLLKIVANNPEQEEAEELIQLDYQGICMEIGFNVSYLLDVVSTIVSENIRWSFTDPNGGVLIESSDKDDSLYVVMPMRL